MKRLAAHIKAIGLALLMVFGVLQLPPIRPFSLSGIFTLAWLLIGILALSAQMRQAGLVSGRLTETRRKTKPTRMRGI
jgi:hypothetical protein